LHAYIDRKTDELRNSEKLLRGWEHLNHRQLALITHALRHPGTLYSVEGHQRSHNTVYETARRDLLSLSHFGLLELTKRRGRTKLFGAPPDLRKRIQNKPNSGHPIV